MTLGLRRDVAKDPTGGTEPSHRRPVRGVAAARAVWLATVVQIIGGVLLWLAAGLASPPYVLSLGPLSMVLSFAVGPMFSTTGLLLAGRQPSRTIGWLLLGWGVTWGWFGFALGQTAHAMETGRGILDPAGVAWFQSTVVFAVSCFCGVTMGLLFPEGRPLRPRWRWAVVMVGVGAVLTAVGTGLTPGPMLFWPELTNPFVSDDGDGLNRQLVEVVGPVARTVGLALLVAGAGLAFASLATRYRHGGTVVRHQLKWLLSVGAPLSLAFGAYLIGVAVGASESVLGVFSFLFLVGLLLVPMAILIAIRRHRLYQIDLILNRAVVYGGLTAVVAGLTAASVRLLTAIWVTLTGEDSDFVLVLTTLVIVASFTPIKNWLEDLAQQHFPPYDPGKRPADEPAAPGTSPAPAAAAPAVAAFAPVAAAATPEELARALVADEAVVKALYSALGLKPATEGRDDRGTGSTPEQA